MKKLFTACICILLLAAVAVTAFAAPSAQMTISAQASGAMPGETVVFSVALSAVENCRSAGLMLDYDKAVFEFVEGKCAVDNTVMADFSDGVGVFALNGGANISGEVFTFRLKVKSGAAGGAYRITAKGNVRTTEGSVATMVNTWNLTVAGRDQAPEQETKPVIKPEVTIPSEVIQQIIPTIPETVPVTEETTPETTVETTPETVSTEPSAPTETREPAQKNAPSKKFQWWIPAVCGLVALSSIAYIIVKKKKQ